MNELMVAGGIGGAATLLVFLLGYCLGVMCSRPGRINVVMQDPHIFFNNQTLHDYGDDEDDDDDAEAWKRA